MTTGSQPIPAGEKPIGPLLGPLRDLAAYALAGLPAVLLFVAVVNLFGTDFVGRTQYSFGSFVNLVTIFFPLAAVLLAVAVKPAHPKARLIVIVALAEYAVVAFFGLVFGVLFGVSNIATNDPAEAFTELLSRAAWLAVFAVAAYAVVQIWRGVFSAPRPQQPPPGVYGQPQYAPPYGQAPYGQPQYGQPQYGQVPPGQVPPGQVPPGQPPYGAPYGQPGYPAQQPPAHQQGQPPAHQQGQPPAHPQAPVHHQAPGHPQNAPQGQPAWNQPSAAVPPVSAAPSSAAPSSAAPVSAAPSSAAPSSEPTQVVLGGDDRTEKIGEDRPGFGPAGQDPPRH